jgi:methylmalonyl-CoA mutase cobalamin-binding subunit
LEELFGPGEPQAGVLRGREPIVRATTVAALEARGDGVIAALSASEKAAIRGAEFTACVTCTDVHEYGKILVETALERLDVALIDAGVSADPDAVARCALEAGADFVAISTYNGVALDYLLALRGEMERVNLSLPIFIGGKLNQIPNDGSSMPVDVSDHLEELGAIVCHRVEDMLITLAQMARRAGR